MSQIPIIPVMDYRQYRKMRRLVHSCCNYDSGNCLALDRKRCCVCGARFLPGFNRAKYCPNCAAVMKRKSAAARKRKQRQRCHALEAKKTL